MTLSFLKRSLLLVSLLFVGFPAAGFTIQNVSPKGEVKNVRQIRIQFAQPMIAFGDPAQAKAAEVICVGMDKTIEGQGRWLEPLEWVYEFSNPLPAGVKCQIKIAADLRDLKKSELKGSAVYEFSTGGPSIVSMQPYDGSEIDSDHGFIVALDSDVDTASVLQHVYIVVDGIEEKIGVVIADDVITKAAAKTTYFPRDAKHLLMLTAKTPFPEGKKVKFVWEKGVKSKSGVSSTVTQTYQFSVREPFRAKFSCSRENKEAACSPLLGFSVDFTRAVSLDLIKKIELKDQTGRVYKPKMPNESDDSNGLYNATFEAPFPPNTEFTVSLPPGTKDIDGRLLTNAANFPVKTKPGEYPSLAKFAAPFGIIEATKDAALPVTVRRLERSVVTKMGEIMKAKSKKGFEFLGVEWTKGTSFKIDKPQDVIYWLGRLERIDREVSLFDPEERLELNSPENKDDRSKKEAPSGRNKVATVPFQLPLPAKDDETQVIGIPLNNRGLHVVEIESQALGAALLAKKASFYAPAAALVTNLAVHFKWGSDQSLVWVTTLDKAEPVKSASVEIFNCAGERLFSGITASDGAVTINKLPNSADQKNCETRHHSQYDSGMFVFASKGDDFSFTHTNWNNGIESWRFSVPTNYSQAPEFKAHTIVDRTLLRAGETLHMKHVFRQASSQGFEGAASEHLPSDVEITFEYVNKWKIPLKWRADGTAESTWKIPAEATLGRYHIHLVNSRKNLYAHGGDIETGIFEVQEFRVALMKTTLKIPAETLVFPDKIEIPFQAQYLAGGAASKLALKMRASLNPKSSFDFPGWREFSFNYRPVTVGVKPQGQSENDDEYFSEYRRVDSDQASDVPSDAPKNGLNLTQKIVDTTLDATGGTVGVFGDLPKKSPYEFAVEAEYRDPNGETQLSRHTLTVYPAERLVGFDNTKWVNLKDDLQIRMMVIDTKGKPQAGVPVDVDLYTRKTKSHRKRVVGGFYAYEAYNVTTALAPKFCHGVSDDRGVVTCTGKISESGEIIAQARVKDDKGRTFLGYNSFWVANGDDWWFSQSAGDRFDLIPEKKEYQPGEKAVFQVRSPFRDAKALVTIEREGVIDHFVTYISGKDPTITVPIKGGYGPNVFVSALLVRGRVGDIEPTAMVDLGKPAFKLGIAGVKVGWQAHRFNVLVEADQAVYRPRQKAKIKVKVKMDGLSGNEARDDQDKDQFKHGKVLIAAVDEGLLQLKPNNSWKVLDEMMGERSLAVRTSTGQLQVIGKRHFGLKAIAAGGGGGAGSPRKLFDTLLLWKDEIALDKNGEATVEIPLNDSLTSFRIVAIAISGQNHFGTGETSIRSSQDVLVFSGLPPVVREGDKFRGAVTIRNTSKTAKDVKVSAQVESVSTDNKNKKTPVTALVKDNEFHLDAESAKEVAFEILVPNDVRSLNWQIETKSKEGVLFDKMEVSQSVKAVLPIRTLQTTLGRAEPKLSLEVERPKDALKDRGGIRVDLSASLVGQLEGSQKYMRDYPYSCLEQKVSRLVALNDSIQWDHLRGTIGSYLDGDGLAKYFPSQLWGSDILTSYVLTVTAANHFLISTETKARMANGLIAWLNGKITHHEMLPAVDKPMRQVAALLALSWAGGDFFQPKLLNGLEAQPQLWPTPTLVAWYELLLREKKIPNRDQLIKDAEANIRGRLHAEGNAIAFAKGDGDQFPWLMMSGEESMARLIAVLSANKKANHPSSFTNDVPKLVQGLLGRQSGGHWVLTTANAWAALGFRNFSTAFETEKVSGETKIQLSASSSAVKWANEKDKNSSLSTDLPLTGAKSSLSIDHQGKGSPWATVSSRFAVPVTAPVKNGMSLERKVIPVEQKIKGKWSRGDIVRVELTMNSTSSQMWVVLNDYIPAGSTILGGAGSESAILKKGEKTTGNAVIAFQERSFEGIRVYYEFVADKPWTFSYTYRVNQDGVFGLPPSRLEAMYAPAMYAEVPTESWVIE